MIVWALPFALLVDFAIGNPVPEPSDDGKFGYEYDVKHPGGSSRVHVSSGSDRKGNYYPYTASNINHGDYISDSSYNEPQYVGPIYRPNSHRHYQRNYHEPSYHPKVPVYEEHTYPRPPTYSYYPKNNRDYSGSYNNQDGLSQSNFDSGSLYGTSVHRPPVVAQEPIYTNPHFVQQVTVDEPISDKIEQVSFEPVAQKTSYKGFTGPSSYPNRELSQIPLSKTPAIKKYEQSPIDQQVLVDEQSPLDQKVLVEEQSPIDQKVLVDEQSPIDQKVLIDEQSPINHKVFVEEPAPAVQQAQIEEPSPIVQKALAVEQAPIDQKVLVEEQSPIDQQILVDKPSPIDQQVLVDEQTPLDQQIIVEEPKEIIIQKPLEQKPELSQISVDVPSVKSISTVKEPPIVQQSFLDAIPSTNAHKPPSYVTKKSPVVQQKINQDSHYFIKKPHITQNSIKHPSQAVYDSPIEPSFSDVDRHVPPQTYRAQPRYRFVPVGPPYEKISHFTKIIHAPPRPYYSPRVYPQKHVKTNFPVYKKPPLSYSIKYPPPPPPPITKTVLPRNSPYSQKTISPPVYQSIKLPPPPPVTKAVVPAVQKHVDEGILLTKNPPVYQTVKAPPPAPVTKTIKSPVLSQVQEHVDGDILLTKNPPVPQSVKLPPPAPITKTLVQADLPQTQEHIDAGIISTKNSPVPSSIKVAHPVAATKTVVASPVHQSVKLPKPPVTKSVSSIKLPPPPVTKSVSSIKLPPPPVTKSVVSVKQPQGQKSIDDDILSKKYPPVSPSIKLPPPPVSQVAIPHEPAQKYIPSTKNAPPSVKNPLIAIHHPTYVNEPTYVKEPFDGQKTVGSPHSKLPSVVSYFNKPQYTEPIPPAPYTVKHPYSAPPVLPSKNTHYSDSELHLYVPSTKSSTPLHGVKQPVISNAHAIKQPVTPNSYSNSKTPHVNSHFSALLSAGDEDSNPPHYQSNAPDYPSQDGPIKNYTPDFDDAPYPHSVHEEELGSNVPHGSPPHFDEPDEEKSVFDKYPVSHAVRLSPVNPSSKLESSSIDLDDNLSEDGIGESPPPAGHPPVSHAIILPTPPKATPVPNLFAAVPSLPSDSDDDGPSLDSAPKSEALVSPISHSVRLPLPVQGNNYKTPEKEDGSKQDFPAFPVESALKQPDPVAEKVAELTNSFTPGEGYGDSNPVADDNGSSNPPSVEEAKAEIDRLNREIGLPFGSRLARSSGFTRI